MPEKYFVTTQVLTRRFIKKEGFFSLEEAQGYRDTVPPDFSPQVVMALPTTGEHYHVIHDGGSRGGEIFEDGDDGINLTLERARHVRDHIINPDYNPRIVKVID